MMCKVSNTGAFGKAVCSRDRRRKPSLPDSVKCTLSSVPGWMWIDGPCVHMQSGLLQDAFSAPTELTNSLSSLSKSGIWLRGPVTPDSHRSPLYAW